MKPEPAEVRTIFGQSESSASKAMSGMLSGPGPYRYVAKLGLEGTPHNIFIGRSFILVSTSGRRCRTAEFCQYAYNSSRLMSTGRAYTG